MIPDIIETEHGREHYRRLVAESCHDSLRQMLARCDLMVLTTGAKGDDFESRIAYLVGSYLSLKEIYNNDK